MKLQIKHQELKPIEVNLDEIRQYVEGLVSGYKGAVYTDDYIKKAKDDRAYLNGLIKDLEYKRKQLKKEWNAPYLAVEEKLKEIKALIDAPVSLIDAQVKDYEARKKDERRMVLEEFFNKWNTLGEMISLNVIFEDKWLNLSVTDNKAKGLLTAKLEVISKDLVTLEGVIEPDFRTACLAEYCQTLNLGAAIAKQSFLKKQKEAQEAVLGTVDVPTAKPSAAPQEPQVEDIFSLDEMPAQEQAESRRFIITATPGQIIAIKQFCSNNGIKIREVF